VLKAQLLTEETKAVEAKKEILELKLQIETGNKTRKVQLEQQRNYFNLQLSKQIEEMKAETLRNAQKRAVKTQDGFTMTDETLTKNWNKVSKIQAANENLLRDVARYKQIEKSQKQEILRFQKELERANKYWEMKVSILQQTMHALKDEMFLRTSLQRQSAKLRHAAITYASDNPASVCAEVAPASASPTSIRKLQLPNVVCAPKPLKGEQTQDLYQDNPTGL